MEMTFRSNFWQFFVILLFTPVCLDARDQHGIKEFLRAHQLDREHRFPGTPVFTHCPNGYIRHDDSCYILAHAIVSWPDALVYCEAYGGHLAYIESEREQQFMTGFLKSANPGATDHYFWIGGTDAVTEGEWFWLPAVKSVKYTHWSSVNPDNDNQQDCIALYSNGEWDDGWCDTKHNFICEIELNTDAGQIVG